MIVVANAGPLIALAHIGQFELLRLLYGELRIPAGVQAEVLDSDRGRPGAGELAASPWIRLEEVADRWPSSY